MLTRSRSNRYLTRARVVRGASRSLLSILGLGVPLALFAQALTSCGSDSGDPACEPNAVKACAIAGQTCLATQVCNADGSAYGACACPDGTGGGAGGSAGAGGSSSTGGGSGGGAAGSSMGIDAIFQPGDRAIGSPCEADSDCPTGPNGEAPLVCMKSTSVAEFGTGGPQGGYCTAVCDDAANSADCQAIDVLSACGLLDDATGKGYCLGLCQPNDSTPPGQNIKCGAERAQACFAFPMSTTVGACFPVCQSDAACGAGLFCDLGATGLGLCTPTAPVGGEIGAPCTADTATADCKSGVCVELTDGTGATAGAFCSANCTFGLIAGCGFDATSATPREAACLQTQGVDGAAGDIGFCFELCDTAADCSQAGWDCVENFSADGQMLVGRRGQCLPGLNGADAGAP